MVEGPEGELAGQFWDLANRFWDFGNYITAFAVGQTIVLSTYLGTSKELKGVVVQVRWWITAIVIVGFFVYAVGIWICYCRETRLRTLADRAKKHREIARSERAALMLRAAALLLSHAVMVGAVLVQKPNP